MTTKVPLLWNRKGTLIKPIPHQRGSVTCGLADSRLHLSGIHRLHEIQPHHLPANGGNVGQFLQHLHWGRHAATTNGRHPVVCRRASVQSLKELGMIDIENDREHPSRRLVRFLDDLNVIGAGIQTNGCVEVLPLQVIQVHGGKHRQQEEAAPQPRPPVIQELGLGLHQC